MNPKLEFIQQFPSLLAALPADRTGKWGKMNAQQMAEHVADFFNLSSGKIEMPFVSAEEHLPKLKAFLLSDKEFRENTKAPVLPEEPQPLQLANMQEAVKALDSSIQDFVSFFQQHPNQLTTHPVFGALNFEEWILLHYKHVLHHAKQFDLVPVS